MSTHTVKAECEITFRPAGLQDDETAYPTLEITYRFAKGSPAMGPTYESGGEPADPDEIELISVKLIDSCGLTPTQQQLTEWAEDWLASDDGYGAACANARDDIDAARESARESAREDRQMERFDD